MIIPLQSWTISVYLIWRTAHKVDCPLNLNTKKELFQKQETIQGHKKRLNCAVHRAHQTCRVVQVFNNRYRLYCKGGTLSENFSPDEMMPCLKNDIPLYRWRQSRTISVRKISDEDLDDCLCQQQQACSSQTRGFVINCIHSGKDCETIRNPNGWLTDSVITASQLLLVQHFPNIHGVQPPALQEVRGLNLILKTLFRTRMLTGAWCPMLAAKTVFTTPSTPH